MLTYQLSSNNVPVLSISLEVRILHQIVIFQNSFPIFFIFSISRWFSNILLYRNLMAVKVLKYQIAEICSFTFFSKFYLDIIVAWSLWLRALLVWNVTISLNYIEFVFFVLIILAASYLWKICESTHQPVHETSSCIWTFHFFQLKLYSFYEFNIWGV